jgi:GDPmannose 4,6-dehydratase
MTKKACITGITGQTGSYLAELLLEKGYEVYGLIRRSSSFNTGRIEHIYDKIKLTYGDLSDYSSIASWVTEIQPVQFYGTAAQSHVRVSFDIPEYSLDIDATGVIRCLEAIRKYSPKTRFLNCATSELFGSHPPPHNEQTPFHPRSPYGVAKIAGFWATVNYREAYDMFACNSISFNHTGPRRGETFVTRKITRAATRIKLGLQDEVVLGNLDAKRDWNHAKDVARAMILMLSADTPDDYVIASGEMHSVREFAEIVFGKLGLDLDKYIKLDPRYLRPSEVDALCGDSTKIRTKLGWEPEYKFMDIIDEMIEYDLELAKREKLLRDNTHG